MVIHTSLNIIALSAFGHVVTGKRFHHCQEDEKHAIIAHEMGHIFHRHALKRILRLIFMKWDGLAEYCKRQELEADMYAASKGHGRAMVNFLARQKNHSSPLHPTPRERIENLNRVVNQRAGSWP